jgi:hypothetical protein
MVTGTCDRRDRLGDAADDDLVEVMCLKIVDYLAGGRAVDDFNGYVAVVFQVCGEPLEEVLGLLAGLRVPPLVVGAPAALGSVRDSLYWMTCSKTRSASSWTALAGGRPPEPGATRRLELVSIVA